MNILLSYRHSGNTWLRYIISTVSEMMCVDEGCKNSIHELLYGTPKFPVTLSTLEKIVYKTHNLELIPLDNPVPIRFFKKLEENQAKLVFIIRDYAEVVFRSLTMMLNPASIVVVEFVKDGPQHRPPDDFVNKEHRWHTALLGYINVLKQYDNYEGPKLLIRYEDLIVNTSECSKEVLNFLNVFDEIKHKDFCKNIDEHRRNSVNLYSVTQGNESFTGGDPTKIKFHNNSIERELDLPNITKVLKEIAGDTLFNRYFTNKATT